MLLVWLHNSLLLRRDAHWLCAFKTEICKREEKPGNLGEKLVATIPFCGEYPGPRFEDKFRSANQMDGISKAGGDKMATS